MVKDFKARGGTVTKHDGAPKTTQDYVTLMTAAASGHPEAIYFGGVTATGVIFGANGSMTQIALPVLFTGENRSATALSR